MDCRGRSLSPCRREIAEREVRLNRAKWVGRHRIRLRFNPFRDRYVRLKVLARDHYTCRWCGGPGDTLEHLIPWSRGGRTTMTNCVCACQECNHERGDLPAEEFAQRKGVPVPSPTGNEPVPRVLVQRGLQSATAHALAARAGIDVSTAERGADVAEPAAAWPETARPMPAAQPLPVEQPPFPLDAAERASRILRLARLLETRAPLARCQRI